MDKITLYGVTPDGRTHKLERVTAYESVRTLSSPTHSMAGQAAVDGIPPSFYRVLAWAGGRQVYDGLVDRQSLLYNEKGLVLSLEARTNGGLLLDNEALPQTMYNVRLSTVFQRHIQVYGFDRLICSGDPVLSQLTVSKGWCEWEVLTNFAARAMNAAPYADGASIRIGAPLSGNRITISDQGSGIPFSSLERITERYNVISKVCIRDNNGAYSTAINCQAARELVVRRKRYVIPSSDLGAGPAQDANQRIKKSLLGLERVRADLPGMWELYPGQRVLVRAKGTVMDSLCVDESTVKLDQNGLITRVELVQEAYLF